MQQSSGRMPFHATTSHLRAVDSKMVEARAVTRAQRRRWRMARSAINIPESPNPPARVAVEVVSSQPTGEKGYDRTRDENERIRAIYDKIGKGATFSRGLVVPLAETGHPGGAGQGVMEYISYECKQGGGGEAKPTSFLTPSNSYGYP